MAGTFGDLWYPRRYQDYGHINIDTQGIGIDISQKYIPSNQCSRLLLGYLVTNDTKCNAETMYRPTLKPDTLALAKKIPSTKYPMLSLEYFVVVVQVEVWRRRKTKNVPETATELSSKPDRSDPKSTASIFIQITIRTIQKTHFTR